MHRANVPHPTEDIALFRHQGLHDRLMVSPTARSLFNRHGEETGMITVRSHWGVGALCTRRFMIPILGSLSNFSEAIDLRIGEHKISSPSMPLPAPPQAVRSDAPRRAATSRPRSTSSSLLSAWLPRRSKHRRSCEFRRFGMVAGHEEPVRQPGSVGQAGHHPPEPAPEVYSEPRQGVRGGAAFGDHHADVSIPGQRWRVCGQRDAISTLRDN